MRLSGVHLFLMLAAGACSARAASPPQPWRRVVLVELFTSQGCSSCPPADAFVRELPGLGYGRDKVVPLTFHVDYWDGLGWKDPFASPALTRRQEWYAQSKRLRPPTGQPELTGLYTPQMIVDGQVHFSGQRREDAFRELGRAAARPPLFDLTADTALHGSTVDVTVHTTERGDVGHGVDRDWRLVVALTARRTRTAVAHGENAGEILEEAAVVRALSDRVALPRDPRATTAVRLTKPADLPWSEVDVVAFVQSEATGEIGGALMRGAIGTAAPGTPR
jgi:hypothetical protein